MALIAGAAIFVTSGNRPFFDSVDNPTNHEQIKSEVRDKVQYVEDQSCTWKTPHRV
jgi:hypothetical protein